jgi:hypothetical protein
MERKGLFYTIQLLVVALLLSCFMVQSLDLTNELADVIELNPIDLEIETETEEESELKDVITYEEVFDDIRLLMTNPFLVKEWDLLKRDWKAPVLEVPELPPCC